MEHRLGAKSLMNANDVTLSPDEESEDLEMTPDPSSRIEKANDAEIPVKMKKKRKKKKKVKDKRIDDSNDRGERMERENGVNCLSMNDADNQTQNSNVCSTSRSDETTVASTSDDAEVTFDLEATVIKMIMANEDEPVVWKKWMKFSKKYKQKYRRMMALIKKERRLGTNLEGGSGKQMETTIRLEAKRQEVFACPFCERSFKLVKHLAQHCSIHKQYIFYKYACHLCDEKCNSLQNLELHLSTHIDKLLFFCCVCGMAFLDDEELKEHSNEDHTNLDEIHQSLSRKTNPLFNSTTQSATQNDDDDVTHTPSAVPNDRGESSVHVNPAQYQYPEGPFGSADVPYESFPAPVYGEPPYVSADRIYGSYPYPGYGEVPYGPTGGPNESYPFPGYGEPHYVSAGGPYESFLGTGYGQPPAGSAGGPYGSFPFPGYGEPPYVSAGGPYESFQFPGYGEPPYVSAGGPSESLPFPGYGEPHYVSSGGTYENLPGPGYGEPPYASVGGSYPGFPGQSYGEPPASVGGPYCPSALGGGQYTTRTVPSPGGPDGHYERFPSTRPKEPVYRENGPSECVTITSGVPNDTGYALERLDHSNRTVFNKATFPSVSTDKVVAMPTCTSGEAKRSGARARNHVCSVCKSSFVDKNEYTRHLKSKCQTVFSCQYCDESYSSIQSLANHCHEHQEFPLRGFPCNMCNSRFASLRTLEEHISKHEGENIYICCLCGQIFEDSNERAAHEASHGENRSVVVPISEKEINSNSVDEIVSTQIDEDNQRYSNVSDINDSKAPTTISNRTIKSCICTYCGEDFPSAKARKIHIRKYHSLWRCNQCPKRCDLKRRLAFHIRNNHAKKLSILNFYCSICNRAFNSLRELEMDLSEHECKSVFFCCLCAARFDTSEGRDGHEDNHKTLSN